MTLPAENQQTVEAAQKKYGLKPALSIPPSDCTNRCGTGPCDCSGVFRVRAWDTESVLAALRDLVAQAERGPKADWLDLLDRAAACYRQGLKDILEDSGHDKPDVTKIRVHAERAISGADYWLARLDGAR